MALKRLVLFTLKNIMLGLSDFGEESYKLRTITNFIFKPYVQDLIQDLNKEFNSKQGNRAYPRDAIGSICTVLHYIFKI